MKVTRTKLAEVLVVEPKVHRDERGFFFESYHAGRFADAGIAETFVQDNHSKSIHRALRGLHGQWQRPQAKLIKVVRGEIFDVAVDIRKGSPTFGQWVGVVLSSENFKQIYVPAGL